MIVGIIARERFNFIQTNKTLQSLHIVWISTLRYYKDSYTLNDCTELKLPSLYRDQFKLRSP